MTTARRRRFREQYKNRISPFYNGIVHVAAMNGVGIAAIRIWLQNIQGATWE